MMEPTQQNTSFNELLVQLVGQTERLLMAHLRLAREEITADGRKLAVRMGGIAFAGVLGLMGLVFLGIAAVAGLAIWVAPWLAALLVSLTFFAICGILAYQSLQKLKQIDPTNRTLEETQETIAWLSRKQ